MDSANAGGLMVTQYPGLVFTGELSDPTGPGSHLATFTSADAAEQILGYFRQKLIEQFGISAIVQEVPLGDGETQLIATNGSTHMFFIMVTQEDTETNVGITTMTQTS
jgi:hypothetical protein